MYELFSELPAYSAGTVYFMEFNLIRRTYLKELQEIQNYYHNRVYAVKSNHFLVYLLNVLDVPMNYSDERYVEACIARMDSVSRTLGMTSETYYGKLHNGVFYGPGSDEILYSVDEYFDIDYVAKNWKDMISVRPLLHPRSDLALMLPNGKKSGSDEGLSSIAINIPMLALQYKYFSMEQFRQSSDTGSLLGVTHFIHMYVLPNMMGPHIDIVILNRLLNLYYDRPMGVGYFRHAFRISDYSAKVDTILNKVIKTISNERMTFTNMLNFIPTIFSSSMSAALQMPDFPRTRQIWWSLLLSRLDYMGLLIDLGISKSAGENLSSIHELQREI